MAVKFPGSQKKLGIKLPAVGQNGKRLIPRMLAEVQHALPGPGSGEVVFVVIPVLKKAGGQGNEGAAQQPNHPLSVVAHFDLIASLSSRDRPNLPQ